MLSYIADIRNAEKLSAEGSKNFSPPPFSVKNFISLSGPYDLPAQSAKFAEHGFHSVLFSLVMKGDLVAYSPLHWLKANLVKSYKKAQKEEQKKSQNLQPTKGECAMNSQESDERGSQASQSNSDEQGREDDLDMYPDQVLKPGEQEEVERELVLEREWREKYLPDDFGIEDSPFFQIKASRRRVATLSPTITPESQREERTPSPKRNGTRELPKITIVHGTKDNCVCWSYADKFSKLLDKAGRH